MKWRSYIRPLLPKWVIKTTRNFRDLYEWEKREFDLPAPNSVKRGVLLRHGTPNATWIETGTYFGETTRILSSNALAVHSIEPSAKFFAIASERLKDRKNIFISHGTSEECLPMILEKVDGDINFWLDGHYSGGDTFQAAHDTPILAELNAIAEKIGKLDRVVVIVDDLRCFGSTNPEYSGYPEKQQLID